MMLTRPGAATTQRGVRPNLAVNSEAAVRDSTSYPNITIRQNGVNASVSLPRYLRRFGSRSGARYFSNIWSTGTTLTLAFSIGSGNRLMMSSSATISGGVPAVS